MGAPRGQNGSQQKPFFVPTGRDCLEWTPISGEHVQQRGMRKAWIPGHLEVIQKLSILR
ncbi:MAG: hypothetical protein ABIB93_03950 [Chloroflexota bacterium]